MSKKLFRKIYTSLAVILVSSLFSATVLANETEDPLERAKTVRTPLQTETLRINTVENAGFEVVGADSSIPGWTEGINLDAEGFEISTITGSDAYDGKTLRIHKTNRDVPSTLFSKPIQVKPGQVVEASGMFHVPTGGLTFAIHAYADAEADFEDTLKRRTKPASTVITNTDSWKSKNLSFTVPEEASVIRLAFGTKRGQQTEAFVDSLHVDTGKEMLLKDYGAPIESVVVSRAVFTTENGSNMMYVTMNGASAQLAKVNLDTFELIDQVALPDTIVRSLAVGADGHVYTIGFNNGKLTKYNTETGALEELNVILNPGHSVYDIVATPDGKIYGGTYARLQDDFARGFEYDIATNEWRDLGVVMDEMKYVHSIAYDEVHDAVYFGLAPHANIRKFDRVIDDWAGDAIPLVHNGNDFSDIYKFVFDLDAYNGKIHARLSQLQATGTNFSNRLNIVIDGSTDELIGTFRNNQIRGVSPERDDKVYFIYYANYNGDTDHWLAYYDLERDTPYRIFPTIRMKGSYLKMDIAQLNDPVYPGDTLFAVTNDGVLFSYNFETEQHEMRTLPVRAEASTVHAIGSADDGTIYISGYTSSGHAKFEPDTNTLTQITERMVGIDNTLYQAEMFIPYKEDNVLIPVYPGVIMHQYDPKQPWNIADTSLSRNPKRLFGLTNSGPEDQERAYGGEVIERNGEDTLAIVTVPARNNRTGRLVFYNLENKQLETHAPILDQSLVSLVHKDGMLYGGSSVWNSYGDAEPNEPEAKMFVWDVEKNELVTTFVPVPDKKVISKLIVGPDDNIWGFADGHLFIYDPDVNEIIYDEAKFNVNYSSITYRDAFMEILDDGNVYGTIRGQLFMIDPDSKSLYPFGSGGKHFMTKSSGQSLFMRGPGQHLIEVTIDD